MESIFLGQILGAIVLFGGAGFLTKNLGPTFVQYLVYAVRGSLAIVLLSLVFINILQNKKMAVSFTLFLVISLSLFTGNKLLSNNNEPKVLGTTSNQSVFLSDDLKPVTHVVKNGETLWGIAKDYYGSGARWVNLAKSSEGTMIHQGDLVKLLPKIAVAY